MAAKENLHKGHRQKVRETYCANGLRGMADHNVLELLLFFGIPHKDTNQLAHELMQHFGSFSGVLQARVEDLRAVKGMTENAAVLLSLFLPVYQRYCMDLARKRPRLRSDAEIVEFIRPYFIGATTELVFLLGFDDNSRLMHVHCLGEGDIANVPLDMRRLASAVLASPVKAAVLVHNHPNGISLPSRADIDATQEAASLLRFLKVQLRNHLILTETNFTSMINMEKCTPLFYESD